MGILQRKEKGDFEKLGYLLKIQFSYDVFNTGRYGI